MLLLGSDLTPLRRTSSKAVHSPAMLSGYPNLQMIWLFEAKVLAMLASYHLAMKIHRHETATIRELATSMEQEDWVPASKRASDAFRSARNCHISPALDQNPAYVPARRLHLPTVASSRVIVVTYLQAIRADMFLGLVINSFYYPNPHFSLHTSHIQNTSHQYNQHSHSTTHQHLPSN